MKANFAGKIGPLVANIADLKKIRDEKDAQIEQAKQAFLNDEQFLQEGARVMLTTPLNGTVDTTVTKRELVLDGEGSDLIYTFDNGETYTQAQLDSEGYESSQI